MSPRTASKACRAFAIELGVHGYSRQTVRAGLNRALSLSALASEAPHDGQESNALAAALYKRRRQPGHFR